MRDFDRCWYENVCDNRSPNCLATCEQYREMKYLMEHSGLPKAKQQPITLTPTKCDLEAFRRLRDIKTDIVDFVDNGQNLYICSKNTGNGKTCWSIKLLQQYFNDVWYEYILYEIKYGFKIRGLFIHVPTFLNKCKDFKNTDTEFEEYKKLIPKVDLIVWDEITSTEISNYDYSQLLSLIDARYLAEKANIYTGGVTSREDMEKRLDAKITSRIWNNSTEVIEFFGGDRR